MPCNSPVDVFLFTGCRLCRRPPKLEEYNYKFMMFCFFGSREHVNLVRIEFSSKSLQELRQIVEYRPQTEAQTFEKMEIDTSVKNSTFIIGLWETGWGKMTVMTVGSLQVFIKK